MYYVSNIGWQTHYDPMACLVVVTAAMVGILLGLSPIFNPSPILKLKQCQYCEYDLSYTDKDVVECPECGIFQKRNKL